MIFGIRHHGPGSAHSLLQGLADFGPDIVLVEGPPDADDLIDIAASDEIEAPAALLVYDPKALSNASFFPFAAFSPEWQAIRFAVKNRIAVRFMDMPCAYSFLLEEEGEALVFQTHGDEEIRDPFKKIAELAGYSDPERWWEAAVERHQTEAREIPELFQTITDLMRSLRESREETRETLLREAFMRQVIRQAEKEGFQRIAVVCGAWHAPALEDIPKIKASTDATLLKGLKKTKTAVTWIPWSFDRLAVQGGYRAGVTAPAWYQILFDAVAEAPQDDYLPLSRWMSLAARLLREEGLSGATANVIEAVRLADTLAKMRQTRRPGIEELKEAALAVLCEGAEKRLELIEKHLVTGAALGKIPDGLPQPALKADFEAQVKSCRLEKNTLEKTLELDLREEAQLRKSRFFHRLLLLQIAWGTPLAVEGKKQGGFHEHWRLKWLPDFEIKIIEAGKWGNTVVDAALALARRKIEAANNLTQLTGLLGDLLKADLPRAVGPLLTKIRDTAALASDVLSLAGAILPLTETLRYGAARKVDAEAVEQLLAQMIPRVCIQLPSACVSVDSDAAREIGVVVLSVNRALGILQRPEFDEQWADVLRRISQSEATAPFLGGLAARLLFDKQIHPADVAGREMQFRLSSAQPPALSAEWLEGFLQGSGLILLHHRNFWRVLDDWVRALSPDYFKALLPVLRRSFSRFSETERAKMLDMVKMPAPATTAQAPLWDVERARLLGPILEKIFG